MSSFIQIALATNAQNAQRVLQTFTCYSSLNVGDPVYIDPSTNNFVLKPADNYSTQKIIGVCYQKIGSTTARVILLGVMGGFSSLTLGATVFLSDSGTLSQTRPTNTGYLQNLGIAVSDSEILVMPNNVRVKLTA